MAFSQQGVHHRKKSLRVVSGTDPTFVWKHNMRHGDCSHYVIIDTLSHIMSISVPARVYMAVPVYHIIRDGNSSLLNYSPQKLTMDMPVYCGHMNVNHTTDYCTHLCHMQVIACCSMAWRLCIIVPIAYMWHLHPYQLLQIATYGPRTLDHYQ